MGVMEDRLGVVEDNVVVAEAGRNSWNELNRERADDLVCRLAEPDGAYELSSNIKVTEEPTVCSMAPEAVEMWILLTIRCECTRPGPLKDALWTIDWP
jgi:hypothetical protein